MAEDTVEEIEIITITDDSGKEEYYAEDVTFDYANKKFAVLVPYSDDENAPADGDAIIARLDDEDGETVYVSPSDEEFEAVLNMYNQMLQGSDEA